MNVNINPRGHSFKGVTAYLMHDKDAQTSERVSWTATHNLPTDDIQISARYMAWTDLNRGDLKENTTGTTAHAGNVYHFSLAWKPGEEVGREHMESTALESLDYLGLRQHQFYMVAHEDTEHPHVHIVVNLAHPETGKIARTHNDFKRLDRWANEYELEHGVVCENRAKKYEAWEQDKQFFKEKDKQRKEECKRHVSAAFERSDNGRSFQAALDDHGIALAQGSRRGFVVVDKDGEVYALNRLIDLDDGTKGRAKTAVISNRLKDLDRAVLQKADALAEQRKTFDRDAAEAAQQKAMLEAADLAAAETADKEKTDAAEASRLRKVQWEERQEEAAKERARQRKSWEQTVARKTAESRERWQIDALTKQRDEAHQDLEQFNGWVSKIFKRGQYLKAKSHAEDMDNRLAERTWRHEADLEAFGSKGRIKEQEPEPKAKEPVIEQQKAQPKQEPVIEKAPEPEVQSEQQEAPEMTPDEYREASKSAFIEEMRQQQEQQDQQQDQDRDFGWE